MKGKPYFTVPVLALAGLGVNTGAQAQDTSLYWGDTHVHTSWSVDAYSTGNRFTGPDDAYRYARGIPIIHSTLRQKVRIDRPLDFMIVGDHAENFRRQVNVTDAIPLLRDLPGYEEALEFMESSPRTMGELVGIPDSFQEAMESREVLAYGWNLQIEAAERHNQPGVFTTFAGWEWTLNPGGNQHRIVFTSAGPDETTQFLPLSTNEGPEPEDLWRFLDETSERLDIDFVAMPHNSNLSNGTMFRGTDSDGRPIDAAYARTRARWEPVMEITQVKGTSEVFPEISPDDDFADFEIHTALLIGGEGTAETAPADYGRYALMRGLQLEQSMGVNPYKLGFIGSSDTHLGFTNVEEDNFLGKTVPNPAPEQRADPSSRLGFFHPWDMSASGIAAVWAEANDRESIFAAFKRREVYGTSGTRIMLRLFGGFNFSAEDANGALAETGYAEGVPMGGDLTAAPEGSAPGFLIQAAKDPLGANLDRVQVIKGWVDAAGRSHEQVFDALWAGERSPGGDGKLPAVGNTVDVETALWDNSIGAAQLVGYWEDPEFDPAQRAFYYARVLEIPTPRHSTYDAVALDIDVAQTGEPATIQERAWSSPIWYTP